MSTDTPAPEHPTVVGAVEIVRRLGIKRATFDMWRWRGRLPEPKWTIGGRPAWDWHEFEAAVRESGVFPIKPRAAKQG